MSVVWLLLKRTPPVPLYVVFKAETEMEVRLVQLLKGSPPAPRLVTPLPNVMLAKLEQKSKAPPPMLVTELGIVTLVRLEQLSKAP